MIKVDCRELTFNEQLALASHFSDGLEGRAVVLAKDEFIVFDVLKNPEPGEGEVEKLVREFTSARKDSANYSVEREDGVLVVRSPDPVKAGGERRTGSLPPNLKKCPFCGFVTPYDEMYTVHIRAHGFT